MSRSLNINPDDSPLSRFAYELKHQRLQASLTQSQLARKIGFSSSQVAMVESLRRNPDELFATACDRTFGLEDHFLRLYKGIKWEAVPEHYRNFREAEERADEVHYWDPMLIPGLFQTDAYARKIFEDEPGVTPEDIEAKVYRRMQRHTILTRSQGPLIVSLIDEGALHRPIGDCAIMREQFDHLLEVSHLPRVTISIVPYDSHSAVGLLGGFAIAFLHGSAYVVRVESSPEGRTLGDRSVIRRLLTRWSALRAAALPQRLSVQKIKEVGLQWS